MRYNQLTDERILSIDALRGITILVMIFVNELAGVRDIPQWMKHMPADADAMTFVDAVFPEFLFIAGMSIPFAINSRLFLEYIFKCRKAQLKRDFHFNPVVSKQYEQQQ